MKAKINNLFKPLYTSNKRYFLLTGGRASLKSTTVHDFIVRLTFEKGHGVLFTRYTMTSAEKSIIPEFKICIERLGLTDHFHITKNVIVNKATESFIYFSGIKTSSGNQTANLKSIAGITTWVVEEGEDFQDEKAFDSIDDSIRTIGKQNRVIWIQNPSTKEHFIYKRWIEHHRRTIKLDSYDVVVSSHPEVEHIHTWYKIATEFLNEAWVSKAKRAEIENPKWYYHNYVGGWLEKAEGTIYNDIEYGKFDESLPYGYGLDFGSKDPDSLIKVAVDSKRKKVYLKEEIYQNGLSTEQLSSIVKGICGGKLIMADSASPRTIYDLQEHGLNVEGVKKGAGSVLEGIKILQGFTLVVDESDSNLIKELNNYVWIDKRGGVPIDDWNHLLDAARYYVSTVTKPEESVYL